MNRLVFAAVVRVGVAVLAASAAPIGAAGSSTIDGVYTETQAARGKKAYEDGCARCHGLDMLGASFVAPTLKGIAFVEDWRGDSLAAVFAKIKNDMPRGDAYAVSEADKLDVLAFILKANDLKAGPDELKPELLAGITFESPLPPVPVGDSVLARVVGCLAKEKDQFVVVKGTQPVRSREGLPSTDAQLKAAAAVPLGTARFTVMDAIPSPAPFAGQRVDVKGILIIRNGESRINVTALQSTGLPCEP